jgi:hypothetical protein
MYRYVKQTCAYTCLSTHVFLRVYGDKHFTYEYENSLEFVCKTYNEHGDENVEQVFKFELPLYRMVFCLHIGRTYVTILISKTLTHATKTENNMCHFIMYLLISQW